MTAWYVLGVRLVIVGAVSGGFGMNLIKASAKLETKTVWYRRKYLMIGLFLSTVFNTTLDLISFAITPLSVIAPLGGVSIISASLFSFRGVSGTPELVTTLKTSGIAMVVFGMVFVAFFGPKPESAILDVDVVFDHFTDTPFAIYQIFTGVVLAVTFVAFYRELLAAESLFRTIIAAYAAGLSSGLCQSLIKLFATCAASASFEQSEPWKRQPEFSLALLELAVVGVLLFVLLKTTVESGPNVSVATCYYSVCVMLATIVAGVSFYKELSLMQSAGQLAGFAFGIAFVIAGMILVSVESLRGAPKKVSTREEAPVVSGGDQNEEEIIE